MGIMSTIKSIFKRNNTQTKKVKIKRSGNFFFSRNKNYNLSAFNTTTVPIPKYHSLSEDEKALCDSFYSEIDYHNYSSIVKFGALNVQIVDSTTKIIIRILNQLRDQNPSYNVARFKEDILSLSECSAKNDVLILELLLAKDIILKAKKESYLRAVALDRYIKRESIRKFDFLGAFGKAERLLYLRFKNTLDEAMQRILISIPTIEFQIAALEQTIAAEDFLRVSTKIYKEAFETINESQVPNLYSEPINRLAKMIIHRSDLLFENDEEYQNQKISLSSIFENLQRLENESDRYEHMNEIQVEELNAKSILAHISFKIDSYILANQNEKDTFIADIDAILEQGLNEDIDYMKNVIPNFYRRLCIMIRVLYDGDTLSSEVEDHLFFKYSSLLNPIYCEDYDWYMYETEKSKKYKKYNVTLPSEYCNMVVITYMSNNIPIILKEKYNYDEEVDDEVISSFANMYSHFKNSWNIFKNENLLSSQLVPVKVELSDNPIEYYLNDLNDKALVSEVLVYTLEGLMLKGEGEYCSIIDVFEYVEYSHLFIFDTESDLNITSFYSDKKTEDIAISKDYRQKIKELLNEIFPELSSAYSYIFVDTLTSVLYEELKRLFTVSEEKLSISNTNTDVAYFPKLVKGIYNKDTELKIELPRQFFNNNTKAIFIHDEFDTSNFYRLLPYLPNLEFIVISTEQFKKFAEYSQDNLIGFHGHLIDCVGSQLKNDNSPKREWTEEKRASFNEIKETISKLALLVVDVNDESKFDKIGRPSNLKTLKQGFTMVIG